jgi:hypothetical protein
MFDPFSNNILSVSFEILRVLTSIDQFFWFFVFKQKRSLNLVHLVHIDIYWWFWFIWVVLDASKERWRTFTTAHSLMVIMFEVIVHILSQEFFSLFWMRTMDVFNNLSWDRCWSKWNSRIINTLLHSTWKITGKIELFPINIQHYFSYGVLVKVIHGFIPRYGLVKLNEALFFFYMTHCIDSLCDFLGIIPSWHLVWPHIVVRFSLSLFSDLRH